MDGSTSGRDLQRAFLLRLYELHRGTNFSRPSDPEQLGIGLGLSRQESMDTAAYLAAKGYLKFLADQGANTNYHPRHQRGGGALWCRETRPARGNPDHIIHGPVIGSQVQQASPGSDQSAE